MICGNHDPLRQQKGKPGFPRLPLFDLANLRLVDFTITGDFGCRGHRRSDRDLRPLHTW